EIGNPSRTRNRSSFQRPRRIFTLPARHCELNGPNRVALLPLSAAGVAMNPPVLPGLARILADPDAPPLAVLRGGIEQQPLNVARIRPPAHYIQQPIAAVLVAAEFNTDGPVRIAELGL